MSIVSDVEDLAPAEFLLMLSVHSKSGKLSAVRGKDKVFLALDEGSIVYAAAPMVGERIGNVLVGRGLVTEEQLAEALERQRDDPDAGLLGTVLMDMGVLEVDDLAAAVHSQFENVLRELLAWRSGVMVFERGEIPSLGAIHVNPADVLIGLDHDVEPLLMESLGRLGRKPGEDERAAEGGHDPAPGQGPRAKSAEVRSMLQEMEGQAVSLTAEMTLNLLRSAAEVAERALVFLAYPGFFQGVGGFGAGLERRRLSGRRLRLVRDPGLVLSRVSEAVMTCRGPIPRDPANEPLLKELGGSAPEEAAVVPLVVKDRVVALVYVDDGPSGGPLGSLTSLESAVAEVAGLLESA